MATRQVLAELVALYAQQSSDRVGIESVGGVDAAKRVQAGEPFDVVILASDAIDKHATDWIAAHQAAGNVLVVSFRTHKISIANRMLAILIYPQNHCTIRPTKFFS